MHCQREWISTNTSRTLDLLRNCLRDGQDGGCKQHGQTATIWLKALLMPRLAVCSRDLHWHRINWTLLCDTMEVSMLRLAWLPIAQHVFQPALTGRRELISRKIVSSEQEQRLSRWAEFVKNCLPRIECKELPRFREKYRALGRHICKIREIGRQKNGVQHATAIYPIPRYTRPRYIGLTLYTAYPCYHERQCLLNYKLQPICDCGHYYSGKYTAYPCYHQRQCLLDYKLRPVCDRDCLWLWRLLYRMGHRQHLNLKWIWMDLVK